MIKKTIDILTSYSTPRKVCEMGNVAVARGAIEANVDGVFSYPGTPSTEISEVFSHVNSFQNRKENEEKYPHVTGNKIYFEYSINEKIALEKAIAYSIANKRALCVMKNVGMNVACDALMSITYQTIVAPLVIVVCDDPGCHSSSNEQDSRYWGKMANVPVFNPSTPAESLEQTKSAFLLSAQLKLPVIVRLTTRVSHTRGVFNYGKLSNKNHAATFERIPEHINIPAKTAAAHAKLLNKLHSDYINEHAVKYNQIIHQQNANIGIITSGVTTVYVKEILARSAIKNNYPILNLGLIYPFPTAIVLEFLQLSLKKIIVIEELDPIIENEVRVIAQQNKIKTTIYGKGFSTLLPTGEFSLDSIEKTLFNFTKDKALKNKNTPIKNAENLVKELPVRPPTLCAGCPHRATFYALKLAIPRNHSDVILCGDIGCNGLGALPPLKMIDTINHMGMSVSMAQGLSEAFRTSNQKNKTVAMLGDGTFFHSGVTSLLNAIYTKANILVIIFDNRTIGMTGHQDHPGATHLNKYHQVDLLPFIRGMGAQYVESIFPFNLKESFSKINEALATQGVSVIVAKSPCIFLPEFKEGSIYRKKIVVDHSRCNTCDNHEDMQIACARCYSPLNNLSRAKLKITATHHVPAQEQVCPANICNHGFFNSIIEEHYPEAVKMVRDKMLFSRTCGDICHRPCELFSKNKTIVPIKKLKRFVSSIDESFFDFSTAIERTKNAKKKNKKVAIVGAGPAGLSAAYDLIREGYSVEIFDKEEKPGGMLKYIIPFFRMDKTGLDYEISILEELGVTFFSNKLLGKDFTIKELCQKYDAVVVAIGLWKSKKLEVVENHVPHTKKHTALSFLKAINTTSIQETKPSNYLIIGGGNSAIDSARAAKKINPNNTVTLICIESRENMPAFEEEIIHAIEEGVEIMPESTVEKVVDSNKVIQCTIKSFHTDKTQIISCDVIITAIGQSPNAELFSELTEQTDKNSSLIHINNENGFTNFKNVFAAGDICNGNHQSVIGAIASGKKAATGIRQLLENYKYSYEGIAALDKLNQSNGKYSIPKNNFTNEEDLLEEIKGMDFYQACAKCNHCIDNFGCPAMIKVNGKIEIDYQKCTNCGLCIDVCPNNAITFIEEVIPA
ncbi:MAG: FAD-dependent oxidoreductase [Flavobacteriales bacterium]|nr:FAD-dependent oxidoreductase [Flavobacteriales bacterium]